MFTARSPTACVITCQPPASSSRTHPVEVVGLDRRRAGRRVVVGVRCEHRGRVRFDDAVEHDLDRAAFEERIVGISLRDRVELGNGRLAQHSGGRQRRIHANAEVAVAPRLGVELEVVGVAAGVLNAGDAVSLRLGDRGAQRARALGPRRLRHVTAHERHRRFLQDAGRLAGSRVLHDDAVRRVRRSLRDPRQPQRAGVHPRRVAVVADDLGRSIGDDGIELLACRQAAGERLVVPPAPQHPGASE